MNIALVILKVFSTAVGALFIYGASRAITTGIFKSPKEVINGNFVGNSNIARSDRPAAFWFCTIAYIVFGITIIFCAWFVI